jgi:hypothetical protein
VSGNGGSESREKTRVCPSCRMEISIFATKCRFCGEPVGRPREEARQLTIQDLGGAQSGTDYAPGGEVLDAIEAFRREEIERNTPVEPPKRTWLGTKKSAGGKAGRKGQDARGASGVVVLVRKVLVFGGILAGIIVLFWVGTVVKTRIDEYLAEKNHVPTIPIDNKAEQILRAGGVDATLKALEEAVRVSRAQNTPANLQVADRIRETLKAEVEALLNGANWTAADIDKASALVSRAAAIDTESQAVRQLVAEVTEERAAYKMTIERIDSVKGEVHLRVQDPDGSSEVVLKHTGDTLRKGRFEVKAVMGNNVRIEDRLRKTQEIPRSFRLFMDGTITVP